MKQRDIKANIVSKSRIEWISEVRILIADFIRQVNKVTMNISHYNIYKDDPETALQITKENGENIIDLNYKLHIITLYFSNNKENNVVISSLNEVYGLVADLYDISIIYDEDKISEAETESLVKANILLEKRIQKSIVDCRDYLKKEWERAKLGE